MGMNLVVYSLFAPPVVLIAVLLVPLPGPVRRTVLETTNRFLTLVVVGSIQVVHLGVGITGLQLLGAGRKTYKEIQHWHAAKEEAALTANQQYSILGKKWREERNFWIVGAAFVAWCILPALYRLRVKLIQLQEENIRLRAQLDIHRSR